MKDQSKTKQPLIQKKASLDKAGEYAESIINTVREPLIILDQDLRVVTASRSFYEFFKVKPDETEGQLIYNLGNDQWDIPKLRELLETILPQKTTFDDYEVEHNFTTIGKRIMLLNARQIKRALGKERIILLAIEDITERKQLESLLKDSEEQYRRLFETASDGIVLLEKSEGKITNANSATEKMLGYANKESVGKKLQDIGVVLGVDNFQTIMKTLNSNGIINYSDVPVETKSGQHIDTEIYLVDRARLVQCNIRDVTERKLAEDALRESEQLFRNYLEYAPDGIYMSDMKATFIYGNRKCEEILGYKREDLIGKNFFELNLVTEKSLNKAVQLLQANMEGNPTGPDEIELINKEGRLIPVEINTSVIRRMGQEIVLGFVRDITNRKLAEKELKESEKKYRLLADNVDDVIFVLDMNLRFTYVSPSVNILMGYEPEELLTILASDMMTPTSWDLAVRNLSETMELEKAGNREISQSQILQLEMRRKDGSTVWTEVKVSFVRDENQRPVGIIGVCRDITKRMRTEKKLYQALDNLRKSFGATVQVMVSAVEARDPYTSGHQLRSARLACAIATEMELPEDKIEGLRMAGSIHDIGKLSIPSEILAKPTKLLDIEFSLIKEHSQKGYEMLKDVESPWPLAQIVYQHHERMNGTGYPRNLKGNEILMEARIIAVADVVEAMASHRPYRPSLGIDAALEEIVKNKGILYDKAVVDACLRLFREKGFQLEGT